MVIVNCLSAVPSSGLVALIVNVDTASEPVALVEPVITPLEPFNVKPLGKEPV